MKTKKRAEVLSAWYRTYQSEQKIHHSLEHTQKVREKEQQVGLEGRTGVRKLQRKTVLQASSVAVYKSNFGNMLTAEAKKVGSL